MIDLTKPVQIPETKVIEVFLNVYPNGVVMHVDHDSAEHYAWDGAIAKAIPIRIEITGDKVKISGGN